ncbi:MAG: hypothetical protein MJB12_17450 [Firmicutes bacterium]|nr:hypothetical protein [Bacillota bacterium]
MDGADIMIQCKVWMFEKNMRRIKCREEVYRPYERSVGRVMFIMLGDIIECSTI